MSLRFALIGSSGYIAPRHIKAIEAIGGELLATLDTEKQESSIQSFSDEVAFFDFVAKANIDYVCICSPSHLHFDHCKKSLEAGCNVICEKPIVLQAQHFEELLELELEYAKQVFVIRQLSYHPAFLTLQQKLKKGSQNIQIEVRTPRNKVYQDSWKGNKALSGGLSYNIGIHYFDLVTMLLGKPTEIIVARNEKQTISGKLHFKKGTTTFFFSIDEAELKKDKDNNPIVYKVFNWDENSIDLSNAQNLHEKMYQSIVERKARKLESMKLALDICSHF